jgi:nucleoid DNA-binding protein
VGAARDGGKTKAFLVDRVYDRHGALTKQEAAQVVDEVLRAVKSALVYGRRVRIQNFGVFEIVSRAGRAGVNPADGQPLFIPPHKGLQFRPAKQMRHEVERTRRGRALKTDR